MGADVAAVTIEVVEEEAVAVAVVVEGLEVAALPMIPVVSSRQEAVVEAAAVIVVASPVTGVAEEAATEDVAAAAAAAAGASTSACVVDAAAKAVVVLVGAAASHLDSPRSHSSEFQRPWNVWYPATIFYMFMLTRLTNSRYPNEAAPHPDKGIQQLENQLMAKATPKGQQKPAKGAAAPQTDSFRFPRRPAYGREGKAIEVWANYFELNIAKMPILYLYTFRVHKGRPPADDGASTSTSQPSTDLKGPFLRKLLKYVLQNILNIPNLAARTELQSKLITLQKIPQEKIELLKDTQYEGGHFEVELDGPHTLDLDGLRQWINTMHDERDSEDRSFPKFQDLMDAIGIIMGHGPRMGGSNLQGDNPRTVAVGNSRYFPVDETREAELFSRSRPLEILRGYFQSVRPATGRLLLNVNVTHSVFRSSRERHFSDLFRDCNFRDLEQALKGARVRITYPDRTSKEFSVSGFVMKPGVGASANMGEGRFKKISEISFSLDKPGPGEKKKSKKKGAATPAAGGRQITVQGYLQESKFFLVFC